MLRSHHGASKLVSSFRRSIVSSMSGFEGNASFTTEEMRSTMGILRGGRAVSTTTRLNPPQHKTWHPVHGINFGPSPKAGNSRLFSTTAIEQDNEVAEAPVEAKAEAEVETQDADRYTMPESSFSYKMREDLFKAAKDAPALSPDSYWLHTHYRGPSSDEVKGGKKVLVHYCQSKHTSENVLQRHFMNQKVIGFDIEWKAEANKNSGPKKNVSLIQLASEERIALLHVAVFAKDTIEDLVPPSLKKIMEDPEISKVGISIKADCTRVRKFLQIDSKGLFELSHLYKLVKYSKSKEYKLINKRLVSLATQVEEHLHLPMFKGEVRSSDWSKKLVMDQITYAAADSYAGIQLYDVLELERKAIDPTPPRPYHADLNLPIRIAEGVELVEDEPAEELEPEEENIPEAVDAHPATTHLPISEVEADPDSDFDPSQEYLTPPTSPLLNSTPSPSPSQSPTRTKPTTTTPPKQQPPKHPLLLATEPHLQTHIQLTRTSTLTHRATPANLRAYFIWTHNPSLTISEIAAVMRSPPLQQRTVASYILEAIKLEGLAYERERVRDVLGVWKGSGGNKGLMARRYWRLEREVGWVDE